MAPPVSKVVSAPSWALRSRLKMTWEEPSETTMWALWAWEERAASREATTVTCPSRWAWPSDCASR